MTEDNDSSGIASRTEEFLQVFKKGSEFTQSLLKENERLRFRVIELEQQTTEVQSAELLLLRERLLIVEAEKQEILARISSVQQENRDFSNSYAAFEVENNLLANLYITTYQLHSTFEVNEILRIIEEILLNLVGVETYSLLLRDKNRQILEAKFNDAGDLDVVDVDVLEDQIASAFAEGKSWVTTADDFIQTGDSEIKAVIPLIVDDDVVGVLALYKFLAQKSHISELDEEIFNLLGGHAAMALCTAILRHEKVEHIDFKQGLMSRA